MRKLLLLLVAGAVASTASAQYQKASIVRTDVSTKEAGMKASPDLLKTIIAKKNAWAKNSANKTTGSGQRVYNYVEYLALVDPNVATNDNLPYMWFNPDMYGIYGATGGGVQRDTIQFASYGATLMPWFSGLNDPSFAGKIALTAGNAYTVDSIAVYGVYGRNSAKTSIVDTMFVSFVYGNGGTSSVPYFTYNNQTSKYGVANISVPSLNYDTARHIAMKGSSGAAAVVKTMLLTTASLNDTIASGMNRFVFPIGANIPAGNVSGVSVTFKSGEAYAPFSDTAFVGSVNPNEPFKYGLFRPLIFEEKNGDFQSYNAGNYNGGMFKFLPDNGNGYLEDYVPSYAYTDKAWPYEFPYVDFVISATNTPIVGINEAKADIINGVTVYPNPATAQVSVLFDLKTASDVNVTLSNAVGQVVGSQNIKNTSNGQATFSVANLSNGVYFYTVESNNQRQTGRVVVSH